MSNSKKMTFQKPLHTVICICAVLVCVSFGQGGAWRGIVPLRSIRQDVERLIGPPMRPNGSTYELKDERVTIGYSVGTCEKGDAQWAVKPGTVINIRVYPRRKLTLRDLNIDQSSLEKLADPHLSDYTILTNREQGFSVRTTRNGEVDSYEYFPSAKDKNLRCPAAANHQLTIDDIKYFQFDEYHRLSFADERARLTNFAARLHREKETVGYIVVYEKSKNATVQIQRRLARAKNYLVEHHGITDERIVTKVGGFNGKAKVELYIVPTEVHSRGPSNNPKREP